MDPGIRNLQQLGAALARLRKTRGLTQGELAKLAGVSQPTISYLESGRGGNLDTIFKIVRTFGLELFLRPVDQGGRLFNPEDFLNG